VLLANVSWRRLLVAIGLGLFASAASAGAALAAPKEGAVVPDRYIVVFKPGTDAPAKLAQKLTDEYGGRVRDTYKYALKGYSARLSDQALRQLRSDPAVRRVEPDRIIKILDTQTDPPSWGLDRIDQRSLPLDRSYNDYNEGRNVHAYVLDSGINLVHQEFAGRLGNGYDVGPNNTVDCNGHGTHVAGTIGGASYGVADQVVLHPVRVADCAGGGTSSGLLAGIDWVRSNRVKPAVANISMGVDGGTSEAVDTGVDNLVKAGVTVAVSAGNDNVDACTRSPARLPTAITVGATTSSDARRSDSNYGTCLDLFAPGQGITSAYIGTSFSSAIGSGTSFASPHVAGVAALYLSVYPYATPGQVSSAIERRGATVDTVTQPGAGSPNRLLYNNVHVMGAPLVNCRLRRACEG
jgi:subtilisin family serine protease